MRRGRFATAAPPARSWALAVRRASDGTLVLQLSGSWKLLDQLPDPGLVAAMSRALDGLSREIAGVLKTL